MTNQNNAAQAIQEAERIAAADEYFKARAWLMDTNDNRRIFEAGFDRAYALLSKLRAPVSSIREGFELTYAADADDPACAADLSHFTNGWRACLMSQVRAPVADERAAFARSITGRDDLEPHQVQNVIDANGSRWATWRDRAALATVPLPNQPPIRLSAEVLEYLKEGIENATQCEEADIDHDFASELGRLMQGPLFGAPPASAPVDTPAPEHFKPPFDNCSFRMCDLPGQCRGEGKCHHPAIAPVAGEAKNYPGDNVAERLDKMADGQPPGSQAQSDLYAAATIWRKHIAHRAAPQASAVAGEAQERIEQMAVNRYRPVPDGKFSYKVVAGDGSRSLYTGTKDSCLRVAAKLTEAFLDGAFVASDAAPQASECECSRKSKAVSDSEAQL